MFFEGSNIREQFFGKGHTRNNLVKLFHSFGEEDFLRISSCPYKAKSLPLQGGHVFRRIKILRTIFEKGHQRNFPVKLFQSRIRGFQS